MRATLKHRKVATRWLSLTTVGVRTCVAGLWTVESDPDPGPRPRAEAEQGAASLLFRNVSAEVDSARPRGPSSWPGPPRDRRQVWPHRGDVARDSKELPAPPRTSAHGAAATWVAALGHPGMRKRVAVAATLSRA